MVCVCVLQDMWPVLAGRTHFVNGSTQFKVQSLKLQNESQKHNTCRDRCITRSSQPLPTSFNRIDESNRSAENEEIIIKFNTAYNIAKEEFPFTKKKNGATLFVLVLLNEKLGGTSVTLEKVTLEPCSETQEFICQRLLL